MSTPKSIFLLESMTSDMMLRILMSEVTSNAMQYAFSSACHRPQNSIVHHRCWRGTPAHTLHSDAPVPHCQTMMATIDHTDGTLCEKYKSNANGTKCIMPASNAKTVQRSCFGASGNE